MHVELGGIDGLEELVPGDGAVELVADEHVAGIHGVRAQLALGSRDVVSHEVPQGRRRRRARSRAPLEALGLGRDGGIVALGGGTTTDVAGFAAATYMRGIPWAAVPTTLVGQVDAAIGGKTAIDLPAGKNLVGAFHWPARVVIDPSLLETLPQAERTNGLAEVVKTGLLAGDRVWELPDAGAGARVCRVQVGGLPRATRMTGGARTSSTSGTRSPTRSRQPRATGCRTAAPLRSGSSPRCGCRVSRTRTSSCEEVLAPRPVAVDPDAAWAALARDKKAARGTPRLVLLESPGSPRWGVEATGGRCPARTRRADRRTPVASGRARRRAQRRQPRPARAA